MMASTQDAIVAMNETRCSKEDLDERQTKVRDVVSLVT